MSRNGNGSRMSRPTRVVGTAVTTLVLLATATPLAARADIISEPPRNLQREEETHRQNQQRKQQAQSDSAPDMTDGNTTRSTPTDIPAGWTEPVLAVTGTLLAGGLAVIVYHSGSKNGRQGR